MEKQVIVISTIEEMETAFSKIFDRISKNTTAKPERILLTRQQAAKFCRMSYHTFGVYVRNGRFSERGMGRKKFFYQDELIQALDSKK